MIRIGAGDGLLVVDVQYDFLPGGALAVSGGDAVIPVLNALIPRFPVVALSRDWHPAGHCSFAKAPRFIDGSWPPHCVQGTPGAEFHRDLQIPPGAIVVSKGTDPAAEAYSAFDGTDLALALRARGVRRLFIGGLATDYCVKASALDAISLGLEAVVVADAVRGVDVPPGSAAAALEAARAAGALVATSAEIA